MEQLRATDLAFLPRVSRLRSKLRSRDSGAQAATFRPSHQVGEPDSTLGAEKGKPGRTGVGSRDRR